MDILLATSNSGKIKEFKALLSNNPKINLISREIIDVPETAWSFEDNALLKAREHALKYQVAVIAEDSGIIVPALKGSSEKLPGLDPPPASILFPGVLTKRFFLAELAPGFPIHLKGLSTNSDHSVDESTANNQRLLELMKDLKGSDRGAYYEACMVLVNSKGELLHSASGKWQGAIATTPQGQNGFGHDPIFEVRTGLTAAMLSTEEKNALSHRGLAARDMVGFISNNADRLNAPH